jgi:S1-C subfamily serine protease
MFEKTGEVRKVIGFCSAMRRMEVLEASDEVNPVFRSVFPGTPLGRELQTACKAANQPFGGADPQAVDAPYLAAPTPGSTLPRTGPTTSEAPKPRSESVVVSGSGFVVAPGVIATNRHVIEDCDGPLKIRFDDAMYSGAVWKRMDGADLALVRTEATFGTPAPIRGTAQLGEDVMAAGFPLAGLLSSGLVVTGGQVNSLAGLRDDPTEIQISAPVQPGNSGGPLVDRHGEVAGVIVSKLNAERLSKVTGDIAQNVNFAVKPELLKLLLEANHVRYRAASNNARLLSGVQMAQAARSYTVQLECPVELPVTAQKGAD